MALGRLSIVLLIAVHAYSVLSQTVRESDAIKWNLLPTTLCGRINTNGRISPGNKTLPFEYLWMVLLLHIENDELVGGCGGSLISTRYVLTAAHCVKTPNNFKLFKVRLGEHDRSKEDDADRPIDVDIESTIVHNEYNKPIRFRNDIALIRMAQEVTFSDSIIPICLPTRDDVRSKILPQYILTGRVEANQETQPGILLKPVLKHVPVPECKQKIQENAPRIALSEEHQMCAADEEPFESCRLPTGIPLGYNVDLDGNRFVQYGIRSFGVTSCGLKIVPEIYTRVSGYMNWIVENIQP